VSPTAPAAKAHQRPRRPFAFTSPGYPWNRLSDRTTCRTRLSGAKAPHDHGYRGMMTVRRARNGDVEAIMHLAALKRSQYAVYNPTFHRPATDAREKHAPFIAHLVDSDEVISYVEDEAGKIRGFLFGTLTDPPPVYDPGGKTCLVDDFMVDEPDAWESVGRALLNKVAQEARSRGAVQVVVVCGPQDTPKRTMLTSAGCEVATEWLTKPL
jgi:GNAT superfamily N-acetyltransferase